jgi:hypothetical protein
MRERERRNNTQENAGVTYGLTSDHPEPDTETTYELLWICKLHNFIILVQTVMQVSYFLSTTECSTTNARR